MLRPGMGVDNERFGHDGGHFLVRRKNVHHSTVTPGYNADGKFVPALDLLADGLQASGDSDFLNERCN